MLLLFEYFYDGCDQGLKKLPELKLLIKKIIGRSG
jgi:hypothetical protein